MNLGTLRIFPSATVHGRADGAVHTYAFGALSEVRTGGAIPGKHKLTGCMACGKVHGNLFGCWQVELLGIKLNSLGLHSAMT